MELYIMRHGETVWNSKGIIQGRTNNRLSKKGIEQVEKQAEKLKNIKFDYIFASPLMRTMQTANIINKFQKKKIVKDNRIIEIDQGIFSKRRKTSLSEEEKYILSKREDSSKLETYDMVQKRINDFVSFLKLNFSNEKILIVTHRGIAKMLYITIKENKPVGKETNLNLFDNAEVKKIEL